jgi:hypothetical protein
MLKRFSVVLGLLVVAMGLVELQASGGSGGNKYTIRITGYVTAIDNSAGTITFGTSYYNTGTVKVTAATKVVRNTVNSTAADIRLGDYGQADATYPGYEAKKIEVTGTP